MTNDEKKSYQISVQQGGGYFHYEEYNGAMAMAIWKNEQINLLLDAIDHAYLQVDGSYGDLALEVVDKVEYLKSLRQ